MTLTRPTFQRAETDVGPGAALRLIASRQFGPYFVGNALSAMGLWFHNLAAAILIYRLTGSEFLLGLLTFGQFFPSLALASVTGSIADRFDRRRVIAVSETVAALMAASLAALAWADAASVGTIIGLSLALGTTKAVSAPSAQALVVSLVEPRHIVSAVALNSMTFNLARTAGPALAAVTITTLGIPAAFAINAISYIALATAVTVVRPVQPFVPLPGASTRMRDTLRLVRDQPRLGGYLLLVMIVGFASDPINTLGPAFAEALGRPDTDVGILVGAFGVGAVAAALLVSDRLTGGRRSLGVTMLMLGGGVILFSLTPLWWLGIGILTVAGFGFLASNAAVTTRLQLDVAENQRGRIMALWGVAFMGMRPLASLLDGIIASTLGVRSAGVVLAVPALLAAGVLLMGHRLPLAAPLRALARAR